MSDSFEQGQEIPRSPERSSERGAVLIMVAGMLIVLMGMAAFAVDYGWLYFNQLNAKKAAESAALAGVAHMPLPDCANPDPGTLPYKASIEIALSNGYSDANGDSVSPAMGSTCARMQVTVQRTVPTFFMRAFGRNSLFINESATAEHLPILKLGSDDSFLGEDPTIGGIRDVDFFLAVNGDYTLKAQGDSYTPQFLGDYNTSIQGDNPQFISPSYWYAIDVPAAHSGDTVTFQIYDPQTNPGAPAAGSVDDRDLNNGNVASADERFSQTRFRVYKPDATPNVWTDNSALVPGCDDTYLHENSPTYNGAWANAWAPACSIPGADEGVYVIEVTQSGDVDILNAFSFRALTNGNVDNGVAIYGLGSMSLWMSEAGSSAQFKAVKLADVYADARLIIELWDIGDIDGTGSLEFMGSLGNVECEVRERDERGVVTVNWHSDDDGDNDHCRENISPEREHNNEWIDFAFEIPPDFTCTGQACWATVQYNLPGQPHDRTTWTAFIDGQPIHLIP